MKNCFWVALATIALSLTGCGSANNGPTTLSNDLMVPVHAAPTLAQRIDAGDYAYVNGNVLSDFKIEPIAADYQAKLIVIHFNRPIGSADAVLEMQARGLRPVNTAECLAYGAAQKRISQAWGLRTPNYWTVCLGSTAIIGGGRHVLALGGWDGDWDLSHDGWASDWDSDGRFLAARN